MRGQAGLESCKYANSANAGESHRAHASDKRAGPRWFALAGIEIPALIRCLDKKQFKRGELARRSRYATRLDSLPIRGIRVLKLWALQGAC